MSGRRQVNGLKTAAPSYQRASKSQRAGSAGRLTRCTAAAAAAAGSDCCGWGLCYIGSGRIVETTALNF
jgi:hypothetical protein